MAESKRESGYDEDGNALKSVNEYKEMIADAEKKMALAVVDKKKEIIKRIKEEIVEYELTIGDLRGDATKQLMGKSKSWTYIAPPKKPQKVWVKLPTNFVTKLHLHSCRIWEFDE